MITINNWSSLQSYKDRKPPWIRLHKTLLDNFEFHGMSSNARALLPMLWLLASEHTDPTAGVIEASIDKIAFRLRLTKKDVISGIKENEAAGFLQQKQACNKSVTKPLQDCMESVTPEAETETETHCASFDAIWKRYPSKTGKTSAEKRFDSSVKTVQDEEAIHKALDRYLVHLGKESWKKPQNGSTWFGEWRDWTDFEDCTEFGVEISPQQRHINEKGYHV